MILLEEILLYIKKLKKLLLVQTHLTTIYIGTLEATTPNVQNVPVRKVFKARIRYDTDRSLEYFRRNGTQVKVIDPIQIVWLE